MFDFPRIHIYFWAGPTVSSKDLEKLFKNFSHWTKYGSSIHVFFPKGRKMVCWIKNTLKKVVR
jgi:hypothetical protein